MDQYDECLKLAEFVAPQKPQSPLFVQGFWGKIVVWTKEQEASNRPKITRAHTNTSVVWCCRRYEIT